jgi:hypothetical protein
VGRIGLCVGVLAVCGLLMSACSDPPSTDGLAGASPSPSGLPLNITGTVLHEGDYCHFDQVITPGNDSLPVTAGCIFSLTKPADTFATDGGNYSVSEVVGDVRLGVRGVADAKVMVVCRIPPRAAYWFWVSTDGHWNISDASDVHNPVDLVSAQTEDSLRQYVKTGGTQNDVAFRCTGGVGQPNITLAMNVNGHQFAAVSVPMPSGAVPLDRPSTPWFVDIGARLTSTGSLEGVAAAVTLYDHE